MIRRAIAWLVVLAAPCALAQEIASSHSGAPRTRTVRFLLTFDDGPYGQARDNPTESILDTLAHNDVCDGMKAIFFLQTRSSDGGATERGKDLMQREQAEGHVLALHDGSTWGHRSHRNLSDRSVQLAFVQ